MPLVITIYANNWHTGQVCLEVCVVHTFKFLKVKDDIFLFSMKSMPFYIFTLNIYHIKGQRYVFSLFCHSVWDLIVIDKLMENRRRQAVNTYTKITSAHWRCISNLIPYLYSGSLNLHRGDRQRNFVLDKYMLSDITIQLEKVVLICNTYNIMN